MDNRDQKIPDASTVLSGQYVLRSARWQDGPLLWEWANDPAVRSGAFSSEKIRFEEHWRWFARAMERVDITIYIFHTPVCPPWGFVEVPIGQCRLEREGLDDVLDYSIAAPWRGQGYGTLMLGDLRRRWEPVHGAAQRLVARIKPENLVSRRALLSAGFLGSETEYFCRGALP